MQLLSRPAALQGIMLSLFSCSSVLKDTTNKAIHVNHQPKKGVCQYHPPPPPSIGVAYADDDTVFGEILRGECPCVSLQESVDLLAFEDIHPRAPLHALIIPKRFIRSVFDLQPASNAAAAAIDGKNPDKNDDVGLLLEMQEMAVQLVRERYPVAYAAGDYMLCFHIPPCNSVNHLHLHVLAPASAMGFYDKYIKYRAGTRWCTLLQSVLERAVAGQAVVPYQRPVNSSSHQQKPLI